MCQPNAIAPTFAARSPIKGIVHSGASASISPLS